VTHTRFIAAAVLATLASFTLASGQLVWLIGLASLLHQSLIRGSVPVRYVLGWLLAAALILISWRVGLDTRVGTGQLLDNLFRDPGHYLLYTLTLLGSAVSDKSVALAAGAGAAQLTLLVAITLRRRSDEDIRLELCGWFIVVSAFTIALGRGFTSVDYALSSRYSVPSVLFLATTWTLLAIRGSFRGWGILASASVLALIFNLHYFKHYSIALQPYMVKRVEDFNRGRYPAWPYPMKASNRIVEDAIERGIYRPPQRPLSAPQLIPGGGPSPEG
jgi:hypothetical protein